MQIMYMQTNNNEVVVLQQGGDMLMKKWQVQDNFWIKSTHERQRYVREMKGLKRKMEVQEMTFNYIALPQPRILTFFVCDG